MFGKKVPPAPTPQPVIVVPKAPAIEPVSVAIGASLPTAILTGVAVSKFINESRNYKAIREELKSVIQDEILGTVLQGNSWEEFWSAASIQINGSALFNLLPRRHQKACVKWLDKELQAIYNANILAVNAQSDDSDNDEDWDDDEEEGDEYVPEINPADVIKRAHDKQEVNAEAVEVSDSEPPKKK